MRMNQKLCTVGVAMDLLSPKFVPSSSSPSMAAKMAAIMAVGPAAPPPNPKPPPPPPLSGRLVAFTTPPAYSPRLARLLSLRGAEPLPVPTISVDPTPDSLRDFVVANPLEGFAGVAFTSRTGILAFSQALDPTNAHHLLSSAGPTFTLAALGKDADLLYGDHGLASILGRGKPGRIRILVPEVASPAGLVKSLGFGSGRKILCPVPTVVDLTEPPVIPDFLHDLEAAGWIPVRVSAYETRWMGPKCLEGLVDLDKDLDAIIFTSTAEVEGLIMGLEDLDWDWEMVRRRWPKMLVGAHGPVTAKGAKSYGVSVDVVSRNFSSFDGVLDALDLRWAPSK